MVRVPASPTMVRVPASAWHWSRYLHPPGTGQGACIRLALVRVPASAWHWEDMKG